MTAPPMLWPVWSFANPHHPLVAWFFTYDAAVEFVTQETDRNLYIGKPRYGRRKAAWVIHGPKEIGTDRWQVAA